MAPSLARVENDKVAVIITRPEPDASYLADQLYQRGVETLVNPVMEIINKGEEINLAGISALAFTSANGVRAFVARGQCRGEKIQSRAKEDWQNLPVFVVGKITAQAAHAAGFYNIHSADGDVESLARLIVQTCKMQSHYCEGLILHGGGSVVRGDLAAFLKAEGIKAHRSILYQARAILHLAPETRRVLAADDEPHHCLFYSARSADIFLQQIEQADLGRVMTRITACCLSDAIADHLDPAAWQGIKSADEPTTQSLCDLFTP